MIKVATWNLCLGLKNKKDYVYDTLRREKIDVCLLQEVEININYPLNILSAKDYNIEVEKNDTKARCAIVIGEGIEYERREELEGKNLGIVVIDVNVDSTYRIVNVYRQFNPPNNLSQREHFSLQLKAIEIIQRSLNGKKIIIAGDFNLDEEKRYSCQYRNKDLFVLQNEIFDQLNLIQMVQFKTWKRIVNNTIRESILDHIYVNDCSVPCVLDYIEPLIGDHKIVTMQILGKKEAPKTIMKRNWRTYSKENLITLLNEIQFNIESNSVQASWNLFENLLLPIIDKIAPLTPFENNATSSSLKEPRIIKNKMNLRKRLLRKLKLEKTNVLRDRIKNLNVEIRCHFHAKKSKNVRRNIRPGNTKSLWDAVKVAKDTNIPSFPKSMTLNNNQINSIELPDAFASFFVEKTQKIVNDQVIDPNVYNGVPKINCTNINFMKEIDVINAVKSLNSNNTEGHDRIPVRIIVDSIELLSKPLAYLFNEIYSTKQLPEQWLISKVIPIHKKGSTSKIENYRPISNLCACSKIFEKLILNQIKKIEIANKIDLTNKSQHGFKSKHSTLTAGLKIQSLIARAVDDDMYALMASLDLSSAFDVVNVELLMKRLRIIGLPDDMIELISNWLTTRYFYVSIEGSNSFVHTTGVGTVQGSILGPVLYSLFVSPLAELENLVLFADDNYILEWNKHKTEMLTNMENKLKRITTWLTSSGLKVNETKTELCMFHRNDHPPIEILLNNQNLKSKSSINVLGVLFDSKLNWQSHVEQTITKAKKSLHAIRIIKKYFNKNELLQLVTSNYYSILYYNSEIWHIPTLNANTKQSLLSASSAALKICIREYDSTMSFAKLHLLAKRATPPQVMKYKHAIQLHKVYNNSNPSFDWLSLFFNQNFNNRATTVKFFDTSTY